MWVFFDVNFFTLKFSIMPQEENKKADVTITDFGAFLLIEIVIQKKEEKKEEKKDEKKS